MSDNAQIEGGEPKLEKVHDTDQERAEMVASIKGKLDDAPEPEQDPSWIEPTELEAARERKLDQVLEEAVHDRVFQRVLHYPGRTLFIVKLGPHGDRVELCVLAATAVDALAEAKKYMQTTSDEDVDIRVVSENVTVILG